MFTPCGVFGIGALRRKGWEYEVDEGGGAFYGPKIDIKIRDAIGQSQLRLVSLIFW
jgi:threonyl-tRNA synthetase